MDKYYKSDPDAQPFKEYSPKVLGSTRRPRLQWADTKYKTLPESLANEQRHAAILNPDIIDTVSVWANLVGSDAAGKLFTKFLDNLDQVEVAAGHYTIK